MIVHTPAIVLKSFPYGDTSIIARCFSQEKGKISLMIKGARSKRSPKSAQFQPLSYVDLIYNHKPNRNLHILSKVNFREFWSQILDDLRKIKGTVDGKDGLIPVLSGLYHSRPEYPSKKNDD